MTDERANARAAALVILELMPEWRRLPAERKAALLERHTEALLRMRREKGLTT
ncbi:MAG: hypothetical protein ACYDHY_17345 [Acidiferrobacterales bacterium]